MHIRIIKMVKLLQSRLLEIWLFGMRIFNINVVFQDKLDMKKPGMFASALGLTGEWLVLVSGHIVCEVNIFVNSLFLVLIFVVFLFISCSTTNTCKPQFTFHTVSMDEIQGIDDFLKDTDLRAALTDVEAGSLADVSGPFLIGTCTGTNFGAEDKSDNEKNRPCLKNGKLIDNDNGITENDEDDRELQVSASLHVNTNSNINDNNGHDVPLKLMSQFLGMLEEEKNNVNENTINESPLVLAMEGDDNNETFGALPASDTFSSGAVTAGGDIDDSTGASNIESNSKVKERDGVEIAGETKISDKETVVKICERRSCSLFNNKSRMIHSLL